MDQQLEEQLEYERRKIAMTLNHKQRRKENRKNHHVTEKLLDEVCPDCGGKMFSGNGVIVYCEQAYYNPLSNCQNILASG